MHIEINNALIRRFKYTLNVRSLRKPVSFVFTRGKTKLTGFPRDLTLSILLYF